MRRTHTGTLAHANCPSFPAPRAPPLRGLEAAAGGRLQNGVEGGLVWRHNPSPRGGTRVEGRRARASLAPVAAPRLLWATQLVAAASRAPFPSPGRWRGRRVPLFPATAFAHVALPPRAAAAAVGGDAAQPKPAADLTTVWRRCFCSRRRRGRPPRHFVVPEAAQLPARQQPRRPAPGRGRQARAPDGADDQRRRHHDDQRLQMRDHGQEGTASAAAVASQGNASW